MYNADAFAANLKKNRLQNGIKQYELAEKLHVSPQSVSKWEQGLSMPDVENLCRLSEIFKTSIDSLLSHSFAPEKMYIGIDGGGTKTEFVMFNEKGNIKQRLLLAGCNPNICGVEKTCETLKMGIDSLRSSRRTEVAGIYCGLSGFLSGDNGNRISEFLKTAYPEIDIAASGDILNVARSATDAERCIAVICGTGANVCAIDGQTIRRVGGWGYLFEGGGSGFDIGRDGIAAALAENDGFGPETVVTRLVERRLGSSVWDSIDYIYSQDKSYIASFSSEVIEAARQKDKVAEDILRRNMDVLANKINYASEAYGCGDTVIISGGLMHHHDLLLEYLRRKLRRNLKIIVPKLPQIYGACVLCCQMFGACGEEFRENFAADYKKYDR